MFPRNTTILFILLCVIFTAGCLLFDEVTVPVKPTTPLTVPPTTDSRISTIEPSEMALQLNDLPVGYIIKERSDVAYADTTPLERDEGWKKGYYVAFYRMNIQDYDITGITQRISVYSLRQMPIVFDDAKNTVISRANSNVTVTELPFPNSGDRSIALRTVDSADPYGIMVYTVILTKKDVFEQIEMRGTTTDYEVLKRITQVAVSKIR